MRKLKGDQVIQGQFVTVRASIQVGEWWPSHDGNSQLPSAKPVDIVSVASMQLVWPIPI